MMIAVITSALCLSFGGDSLRSDTSLAPARVAFEQGRLEEAVTMLGESNQSDPLNPERHHLLAQIYEEKMDVGRAAAEYEKESELRQHADVELLKKIAALNTRMRKYAAARRWWNKALVQQPDDGEAMSSLTGLSRRRSVHLIGSAGGWEVDYTKRTHELTAFVGWIDWLDVYAGYSQSDKIFYNRSNLSFDAYAFPSYRTYVRFGARLKRYEYPASSNSSPDHNAYKDVPSLQIEVSHYYSGEDYFSLELEYFRPNFYWNNDLRAENFKLAGSVRKAIVGAVYAKLYLGLLRDPEPARFAVDPVTKQTLGFQYASKALNGAALGFDHAGLSAELKYIPDRDLDRSIDYSIFTKVQYMWNGFGVQHDLLYDQYPVSRNRGFSSSRVNALSFIIDQWELLQLRVGAKALARGNVEISPFIYVRLKTGI